MLSTVSVGICYACRGCVGVVVSGSGANGGRAGCCVPGAGLSYYTEAKSLCQDCFSMYTYLLLHIPQL